MAINLNSLYDRMYKADEAKRKAEEEAEEKELEDRIQHFISSLETKITMGDLSICSSEHKAFIVLIKNGKPDAKFMYLVDAHIEERIIKTLEEHGIGPIKWVELDSYGNNEDAIEVVLYLKSDNQ